MPDLMNFNAEDADSIEYAKRLESLPLCDEKRYTFLRTIGFGGITAILLMYDHAADREVAFATVPDAESRPAEESARFAYEAQLTAKLEHPNIVPIHDIGRTASGAPYYVMKYLRGQTLSTLLRKLRNQSVEGESFPLARRLQIFIRICNATAFAHSNGIGHFGLNPDDVNIGKFGEVVVSGWGRACRFDDPPNSLPRRNFGTDNRLSGYLAPEQLRDTGENTFTPATDIYALGAILYALLALDHPLSTRSRADVLRCLLSGSLPMPMELPGMENAVPPALNAVVHKAMSIAPEARYASVEQLRDEIIAYQCGYATTAENASPLRTAGLFIDRNKLIALMSLSIVLTAILSGAIMYLLKILSGL